MLCNKRVLYIMVYHNYMYTRNVKYWFEARYMTLFILFYNIYIYSIIFYMKLYNALYIIV